MATNLKFYAAGRRRQIFRRKPGGSYYVKVQVRGKEILRSLGTTVEAAAKEMAKRHIEALVNGDFEESRRLKVRSDYSTVDEVCDIYVKKFGTDERRRHTARGNVGCLKKIVMVGAKLSSSVAKTNILSSALVRRFEEAEEARIEKDARENMNQESERRIRESICSVVRQARSIFKRPTMSWYDGLALPDLEQFRRQGVTAPDRPKPRPLAPGIIESMGEATAALAAADPACYLSHLLFKYLGMRNQEQKFARRGWIVRTPDLLERGIAAKLGVIYRPEEGFKPKKKTERWIPIGPNVLAEIEKYARQSPDGDFIVPAEHMTARADVIDRKHSAWVGQWIKGHAKVSYELRRYAGSLVYRKTGKIEHVQQFLGHADLKTTLQWYWFLIDDVPALDIADFAAPA